MMPALLAHLRFYRPLLCARAWRRLAAAPLLLGVAVFGPAACAHAQQAASDAPAPPVDSAVKETPTADQIRAVLKALDDESYRVRQGGSNRLLAWAASPNAQAPLAQELESLLLDPKTSFETRMICEPIVALLPAASEQSVGPSDAAEIDRLIALNDAGSYNVRVGASARLAWLAKRDVKLALRIADKIKPRLADPRLSPEMRSRLTEVWVSARGVWLASDPAGWPRPSVSDAQLEAWVNELGNRAVDKAARIASENAERELLDLMAHDDQVARVRVAIEKRLPNDLLAAADPKPQLERPNTPESFLRLQAEFEAIDRLQKMHEWTKPAMVAEIWRNHTHDCVQYLEIGVKQYLQAALNPRPTLFDRIDDRSANCVSGNSLAPGDYPVGVAIPPTSLAPDIPKDGRMFHLVNLSTPRRRLLYENYQLKRSEERRLTELTERTTAWWLAQKRTLTEREILMLPQLDPVAVSRFVGPYLAAAEDAPRSEQPDEYAMIGRHSRHALLCLMLSEIGTHECLPGLADAIRRGRVPGPTERATYHVGWLAALAIAERDPWPGVDEWLASLIERDDPLHTVRVTPPEVGATAAAMLLVRHGASVSEFGLIEYEDGQLPGMSFTLCRFNAPERREQVLQWWKQRRPKQQPSA